MCAWKRNGPVGSDYGGGHTVYHYRLFDVDGRDAGDAHCHEPVTPGQLVTSSHGWPFLVVSLLATTDQASKYAGLLMVRTSRSS